MKTKLIYITAPSCQEAERLAASAVTERLAACANILEGVTSIYHWDGRLCREKEAVLILKTTEVQLDRLIARIKELHPCECPCIIVLPIEGGYAPFLRWLEEETR